MDAFIPNSLYPLETFIHLVKNRLERDHLYAIYSPQDSQQLACGQPVYVGDLPDYDDEDNEHLPQAVKAMGYTFCYMREHFQDVIDLAVSQHPGVSDEALVCCLNHYDEYDDFLDVSPA
ncbi:hypothetical protein [Pseudomonas sp. NPDC089401]|uniref:DUF7716 domain-containing protein n=1 Tax=Pseudomonas sp. NPDC089401 TaxID=3364462 RepID=UPI00381B75C5